MPVAAKKVQFYCGDGASPIETCRCGKDHIYDAKLRTRRDPTRTLDLRRAFIRTIERRWRAVAKVFTQGLVDQDLFALGSANARSLQTISFGGGRMASFQAWVDTTLADLILGYDRELWIGEFVRPAYARGWRHAGAALNQSRQIFNDRADIITKFTITELQGVIEVVSQQAVRAFADGLLSHTRPREIARLIRQRIDAVGIVRSRATIQTMIVRAHAEGTLDFFETAGVQFVTLLPETLPNPGRSFAIRDAKKKTKRKKRRAAKKLKSKKKRASDVPRDLVEVITAGDDLVCQLCVDIADGGPYTIDDARGLIPAHPHCRCAFIPYHDQRFTHGDEWDPAQHPRHPAGSESGGEFMSSFLADPIEASKTQRELLEIIRKKKAAEQLGEAFKNLGPSNEQKIANAETMFGTGSPQHREALKKYGTLRRKAKDADEGYIPAEWDPAKHPREPAGSEKGGEFVSKGAAFAAAHPKTPGPEFAKQPAEGTSEERTKARLRLKVATDPAERKLLREKIKQSYLVSYQKAVASGDMAKAEKFSYHLNKLGVKVGGLGSGPTAPKPATPPAFTPPKPTPTVQSGSETHATPKTNPTQNLPPEDASEKYSPKQLIRMYTGSHYQGINSGLRSGMLSENQWKFAKGLNKGLDELPKHEGMVYRKVSNMHGSLHTQYKVGMIVEERGFTSTSTSPDKWQGNIHYHIKSKRGRSVKHLSAHPNENEVLFKSGTRFRVTKLETGQYGNHIIHMEEA